MKKILFAVTLIIIGVVGYFGYNYYTETYVGETAYARVPETTPEKMPATDQDGKSISDWFEYDYELNFVKADGSTQKMSTDISGESPTPLKPGSIVQVTLSKKRILKGPKVVDESAVPKEILAKLQ